MAWRLVGAARGEGERREVLADEPLETLLVSQLVKQVLRTVHLELPDKELRCARLLEGDDDLPGEDQVVARDYVLVLQAADHCLEGLLLYLLLENLLLEVFDLLQEVLVDQL